MGVYVQNIEFFFSTRLTPEENCESSTGPGTEGLSPQWAVAPLN